MLKKAPITKAYLLICLALLPACYRKIRKTLTAHAYDKQKPLETQAYLTDIPLPIQAKVYTLNGSTATSTGLTFIHSFSIEDIISFYQLEMERLGWNELRLFSVDSEVLLIFEKPQKICTVSVRPDNRVILFFGTKS